MNPSSDMYSLAQYGQPNPGMDGGYGGMSVPGTGGGGGMFSNPGAVVSPVAGADPGAFSIGGMPLLSSVDKNGVTTQGYGIPAIQGIQGLFSAYMGMKQYGLYKQQLNESKRQFGLNYDAQRQTTNAALEDRQAARVASNPGAYQSVGDYMDKNSIRKG